MELLQPFNDFLPEIILCGFGVLLLLLDVAGVRKAIYYVAIAGLVVQIFFLDGHGIKIIMCVAALLTLLISGKHQRAEYYYLVISILAGAQILVTSSSFIMILLSMEMISISSYVLTAGLSADKQRAEAAWKFFIYGSVATAVMIFGMTYLYGDTGRTQLSGIHPGAPLATIGEIMVLGGFLFKMTAVPFHLWAPDVYEATPAPIVAYLSVVPKLAAVMVVLQWSVAMDVNEDVILAFAAIVSIVVGTLAALNQSKAKRMMAYSSIAQAGIILAAISVGSPGPLFFYLLVFAIMNYAVFIVIHVQEQSGRGTAFADFTGIGYTNSFAAVAITLGLVSLVGLPPMAGFMAKLFVFAALWSKFTGSQNPVFLTLFVAGLLATAVSLYFYLKIPFYAFFRRAEAPAPIKISPRTNLLLLILVGLLLALFLVPDLFDGLVE